MTSDPVYDFRAAIVAAGLTPPECIEVDGKLHRFSTNGKRGDDSGWYLLHDNGIPVGVFGDWRTDLSETWRADIGRELSPREKAAHLAHLDAMRRERAAEDAKRKTEARDKAQAIWKAATPARVDHPYLVLKAVAPVASLREIPFGEAAAILGYTPKSDDKPLTGRLLIIPVKVGGELSTVEMIDEAGRKSALYGGAKRGGYWAAQPLPEGDGEGLTLLIGEGVATVLSAREATGHPALAALSCGNLEPAAKAMRDRYPKAVIVILADLGKGQAKAEQAAHAVGGLLVVPDFGADRPEGATDFNDLYRLRSPDAVRETIVGGSGDERPDTQATVARLAGLSPIEYDRAREGEAAALKVRVSTLDAEVKKLRTKAASDETGGQGAAVLFGPLESWPDAVHGAELLADLVALCRRYVVLPKHADVALALWIVFTYCVDAVSIAPILALTSPEKRCGKSTMLALLGRLVLRPLPSANITAAPLFRAVEAWAPTLLIDEADTFIQKSDELRGILNSGHTRELAYVIRTVGEDHEPRKFSTWGAKAIASIGKLKDTLSDRSIEIRLKRKLPGERVERLRHADPDLFHTLARRCARFAADHITAIRAARPLVPEALHDRAADNWEPLLAIADLAGGGWPDRASVAALALSGGEEAESDSLRVQLLTDVRDIFEDRSTDRISSEDLTAALVDLEERPWAEYSRGKPLTKAKLARLLRPFGVVSGTIRLPDGRTPKGYLLQQYSDAFTRYLPAKAQQCHNVGGARVSADFESATAAGCGVAENGRKANSDAGCGVVADSDPPLWETRI